MQTKEERRSKFLKEHPEFSFKDREYNKEYHKEYNKKYGKKYRLKHKEEKKLYDKKYREKNKNNPEFKKKRRIASNNYYWNNKEKFKKYNKQYSKETKETRNKKLKQRRKTDPNFRIIGNLRSQQQRAIKGNQKSGTTIDYLGCSIEYFKKYIEDQFVFGMTWDNYGKEGFHIDHQIPLSIVDLNDEEDLRHVLHYTNLQPMWATENISKGNKINR